MTEKGDIKTKIAALKKVILLLLQGERMPSLLMVIGEAKYDTKIKWRGYMYSLIYKYFGKVFFFHQFFIIIIIW